MEDNELDISLLVEKYENMRALGKKIYFDADEFAMLAEYYNAEGDNEEAEELINEGLKMHPVSPVLMMMKAKLLVYSEMYQEAIEYLESVSDDGGIDMALLKIESYLHLGKHTEADKLISSTLKQDLVIDDLYFFIIELGFMFNDVDLYDRAISFLEESMKINDSNNDTIIDLAYSYEMKGDLDNAIACNNKLLDIDPYSYDGWVNIGKLYSMNDQHDKAIDAFDFALTISEDDPNILKMKALSLYLNDNLEAAVEIFQECLEKAPKDETVYDSLLEAYEVMEQYDRMMELIDKRESVLGSKGIIAKRAFVYIRKGDYEKATELFNLIPEDEKDTLDYYMLEGELAFFDENFAGAETAYMKAALTSEGNEDVLDRLANICVAQEKFEQAADYLEELLKIDPDFPTAKSRLAFIRFEIGSKEPFDEIMKQFTDQELKELLNLIIGNENYDFSDYNREKILTRLNEARENRVLFKNIKY